MNILILVSSLSYGGAEKQAVIDANLLSDAGHDVTVGFGKRGELERQLGASVKRFDLKISNQFFAPFMLLYHLLFHKYDIIHAHMFWAEKVACIPSFLCRTKLILNEHGLGLWRKWYHILIMRFVSLFPSHIICSCEKNKTIRIEQDRLPSDKLFVVYNSFNFEKAKTENDESSKNYVIGFVGRFHRVKRLEILIESAKILKKRKRDFKFILVGDGETRNSILDQIKNAELDDFFELPGFVSNPSLYYHRFDVFVLPSKIEAFSLALIEASAYGLPCLAFDVGGNGEIIRDGKTGFLIPEKGKSAHEFSDRLLQLYSDASLRKKMGESASNFVHDKFSNTKRINNLLKIYQS